MGNLWEWCLDTYANPYDEPRKGDGLRATTPATDLGRVIRGGGFTYPAPFARSGYRTRRDPSARVSNIGVRPARALIVTGHSN